MSKIELIHGDCMDLLRSAKDKQFDLAICDPPYGIDINMNMGRKKGKRKEHDEKKWDNAPPQ